VTLKPGFEVTQVIENDTIRSVTHDFLLTFHSNHRPISHRFRDNPALGLPHFLINETAISVENRTKIANFSHRRVFNAPAEGFPLELCIGAGVSRN